MKKGIGPRGLGVPKGDGNLRGARAVALQAKRVVPSEMSPTERTYTSKETKQMTAAGNQPAPSNKDYGNKKTAKQVLKSTETKHLREALQKNNYGTSNMSLNDMRKVAKTKGIYDSVRDLSRSSYKSEINKS
jgi:hypothetical protein